MKSLSQSKSLILSSFIRKPTGTVSTIVSLVAIAFSASASAAALEEIVVTAQKREQRLQDVPISISAINGDEILRANAQGMKELVNKISGVLVQDHYGTNTFYVIRGIGLNDYRANSAPSAAVYVDEIYQGGMLAGSPSAYDVERVEFLKGPQGTLYGRNASSGAINLITRKPTDEFEGYAKAGIGRFSNMIAEGAVSGPINENFLYRLSGQYNTFQDTVFDNVSPDPSVSVDPDAFEPTQASIRGQLLWQPSDVSEVLLKATYTEKSGPTASSIAVPTRDGPIAGSCPGTDGSYDANFAAGCTAGFQFRHVPSNGSREVNHNIVADNDFKFWEFGLTASREFDWANLTSISAYSGYDTDQRFDFDATISEGLNVRQKAENAFYSQELRLASTTDEGTNWMIGGNASYERYEEDQRTFYAGLLDDSGAFPLGTINYIGAPGRTSLTSPHFATRATDANAPFQDIVQRTTSIAVFTDNEIPLTETLSLIAGYRYTYEKRELAGAAYIAFTDGTAEFANRPIDAANGIPGPGDAVGSGETTTQRSSGRIGLNWQPTDELLIYTTFSESFKSGGFDAGFMNNVTHLTNPYKPEIVSSFEIGIKADPLENLRVNAAVFYMDFDDPQQRITTVVTDPSGAIIPQAILSNVDQARVFGIETEVVWRVTDHLTLSGTAAIIDSEIDDPDQPVFDGNSLSHSPDETFTVDGVYEVPFGNSYVGRIQANMKYLSDHFLRLESQNLDLQKSYAVADAQLSVAREDGTWEVSAFVRNLTDEFYFTDAQAGFGATRFNVGMPRTYGISASFNF